MDKRDGICQRCGATCRAIGQQVGPRQVPIFTPDIAQKVARWCPVCQKVLCGRCCGITPYTTGHVVVRCPDCGSRVEYARVEHWHRRRDHSLSKPKSNKVKPDHEPEQKQPAPTSPEPISVKIWGNTKNCPSCGNDIKAIASLCRFCGTRFEVKIKGYCKNCHEIVVRDEKDRCSQCGSEVIDHHVESKFLGEIDAQAESFQPTTGAPAIPPPATDYAKPGSYIDRKLMPGERIIFRTKLHWVKLISALIFLLGIPLFGFLSMSFAGSTSSLMRISGIINQFGVFFTYLSIFFTILFAAGFLSDLIGYFGSEVAVTNQRIIGKLAGIIPRTINVSFKEIEKVEFAFSPLMKQACGQVKVIKTNRRRLQFNLIRNPLEFASYVKRQISPKPRSMERRFTVLKIIVGLMGAIILTLGAILIFKYVSEGPEPAPLSIEETPRTPTHTPTHLPPPTKTPLPVGANFGNQDVESGFACFGSDNLGVTCLDENGWRHYSIQDSQLGSNAIQAMTICPDGRFLIVHSNGINVRDSETWVGKIPSTWGSRDVQNVYCDGVGDVWVSYTGGLSFYSGNQWVDIAIDDLATKDEEADPVKIRDMAIDYEGVLWVVTENSIARFNDPGWTIYSESLELKDYQNLHSIAVDGQGHPWVGHNSALFEYDGGTWIEHDGGGTTMYIDVDDRIWVGTSRGFKVFNDGNWDRYEIENAGQTPSVVRQLALDEGGRVWISTKWGLTIFDGKTWISYHMHTSELADNSINSMVVQGYIPSLPELMTKENGKIVGRIFENGQPLEDTRVQVCIESLSTLFTGATPCSGQIYNEITRTDSDGRYTIEVPPGHYYLTFESRDGKWVRLVEGAGDSTCRRLEVKSGETLYLPEIRIR